MKGFSNSGTMRSNDLRWSPLLRWLSHIGTPVDFLKILRLGVSSARPQDLTFIAHLLVPTDFCPVLFLKLFPVHLLNQAKDSTGIASVMKTETRLQAMTTAQRVPASLDYTDQFELNPWLVPVQMNHGGTQGVLNLIITWKSLPKGEHKLHLHNTHCMHRCFLKMHAPS